MKKDDEKVDGDVKPMNIRTTAETRNSLKRFVAELRLREFTATSKDAKGFLTTQEVVAGAIWGWLAGRSRDELDRIYADLEPRMVALKETFNRELRGDPDEVAAPEVRPGRKGFMTPGKRATAKGKTA